MKIAQFSVDRPVFTIMVVLIVIILGGISLARLPIDLMPDITYPTLSVSTDYENAGPEEVEKLVTRPIEEAMSAVPGAEEVNSSSSEGDSSVRVSFAWGTDLDAAANDVRERLDRVVGRLPEDAERPVLRRFDVASFPILILGAYGNLDPVQMRRLIDDQVKYRLERVNGVAAVDIRGGLEREIRVQLHADRINALGLSLEGILQRLRAANVNVPAGTIERGNYEVLIRTPGEYRDLDELRNTVIAVREGATIQLSAVADVEDTYQRITHMARVDGHPGMRMSINKQSGTNTVAVAREAMEEIERINQDLPQLHIVPIIDTSQYIQQSIRNVGNSAIYGGVLAVLVLLFYLRNIRSTVVIATAIPVSIIGTFTLMYFGGFTLNLMTLGGLALGVGMLVDNSIVVLENIFRLRDEGMEPRRAAIEGANEVLAAITSSTLTTVVVFLPLLFVRGMAGVMYRQLSLVVTFSLLCSMVVAMTVVPMLASRLVGKVGAGAAAHPWLIGGVFRAAGALLGGMERRYGYWLRLALSHRLWVVLGAVALLAGSIALIPLVGNELMPATDEGEVRVEVKMEQGTRIDVLDRKMRQIEAIVAANVPEARRTVAWMGDSQGQVRLSLVGQTARSRSSEDVASALRPMLADIPGVEIRARSAQSMVTRQMGGGGGGNGISIEVRGYDLQRGAELAERIKAMLGNVEGISDVDVSRSTGTPEELILVDRQKAADMKLTVSQIADMLETVLSGTRAGNYREGGDEFAITVQLKDSEQLPLSEVLDLTLVNADNEPVVLRNVVQVQSRLGPVSIERKNQERLVSVWGNVSNRDMGSVIEDVRQGLRTVPVPAGFSIVFGGDYEDQQEAFRELLVSLVLALVLVYMVMACQYESLRDPFVVMFSVPLAAIGVVLMLLLTDTTFNIQSYIGCIMLGGIVVNNAILLVDHTNLLRRRDGMAIRPAILEAGRRRLRPILMTASTTMLGLLPLAIGVGEGGEAQSPLARAVVGGLLSSTLITLVFVPVVYSLLERLGSSKPKHDQAELVPAGTQSKDAL